MLNNCPNDKLGPVSDYESKEMQLIANYNIKPKKQDKSGTTVGKTKSTVQLIGKDSVTATSPKDLNLGAKSQNRREHCI